MKNIPKKITAKKRIKSRIKNKDLVEKRREQIFQAASKLIQKKGYHQTTLRDISNETGISLGNLYDYINTKEDILYIFHEKTAQMIVEATDAEMRNSMGPAEKIKEMIRKELETRDKLQGLILCIYQESHALSKPSLRAMLKSEEDHTGRFGRVIQDGIDTGVFKPTNPTMMANIILMMIDCWVLKRWALRGKVSLEEMSTGVVETVMNGMLMDKSVH